MTLEEELTELVKAGEMPVSLAQRLLEKAEEEKAKAGEDRLIEAINRVADEIQLLNWRVDRKEGYVGI